MTGLCEVGGRGMMAVVEPWATIGASIFDAIIFAWIGKVWADFWRGR